MTVVSADQPADIGGDDVPVTPARSALLSWYDRHRRELPWRAVPGQQADPYRVWLSEVMLQQTTVATVRPRFDEFLARWPRVHDLAAADLDAVLAAWSGLGYYARARNLHACARAVVDRHDGVFPDSEAGLRSLPGIGAYTAAAVAAIAFDRPASVVDGNVERVVARLNAAVRPLPAVKPELRRLADALYRAGLPSRPGDFAQALMDLGATVCVPARPRCERCPWRDDCRGRAMGIAGELPRKRRKTAKPSRYGVHYWLTDGQGRLWLRRRPANGLLGGMLELPGPVWVEGAAPTAPCDWPGCPLVPARRGGLRWLPGEVRHSFTHFDLTVRLAALREPVEDMALIENHWRPVALERLDEVALPSVTAKMIRHAMEQLTAPAAEAP